MGSDRLRRAVETTGSGTVDHPIALLAPYFWRGEPPRPGPCWVCGEDTPWVYLDIGYQHVDCDAYPSEAGEVRIERGWHVNCPHDGEGEGDVCYLCWTNIKTGERIVSSVGCPRCGESWDEHHTEGGVYLCALGEPPDDPLPGT